IVGDARLCGLRHPRSSCRRLDPHELGGRGVAGQGYFRRVAVLAQAAEYRMTQHAVPCPFGKLDVGDELGPDPMGGTDRIERRAVRERRLVDLYLPKLLI